MSQDIPNSTMRCTQGFGANEDVNGIGVSRRPQTTQAKRFDLLLQIVVSLYALGGGKTFLYALLWTLRYIHPREAQKDSQQGKRWVDRVQKTMDSSITSSLASGYAILIAVIIQRK